jgi:hypothetical protein
MADSAENKSHLREWSLAIVDWVPLEEGCRAFVPAVLLWLILIYAVPGRFAVRWLVEVMMRNTALAFVSFFSAPILSAVFLTLLLFICYGLIWLLVHLSKLRDEEELPRIVAAFAHKQSLGKIATVGLLLGLAAYGLGFLSRAPMEFYPLVTLCLAALAAPGITPKILRERQTKQAIKDNDDAIESLRSELLKGEQVVEETYAWTFHPDPSDPEHAMHFEITIPLDLARYQEAANKDHAVHSLDDYGLFVVEGRTAEVSLVAHELVRLAQLHRMSRAQLLRNALDFAHQFRYAYDQDTKGVKEYPRYPIEMLHDREGDCECHAIFGAALLDLLGFDVILLGVGVNTDLPVTNHIAVGIAASPEIGDFPETIWYTDPTTGRRYYYCEATPPSGPDPSDWTWHIGEVPFDELTVIKPIYLRGRVLRNE